MLVSMATPMDLPRSRTTLLPEAGGRSGNFYNLPTRHQLQRNRTLAIVFKFIQLLTAIVCLVLYSSGGQLSTSPMRTALAYGTYGAYIIIPVFLVAGFIIGEVTPILLVGYNLFGAILFALVGSLGVDSWWRVQADLDNMPPQMVDISMLEHANNMKLMSAILSLINCVLYAADTVVEGVILHDSHYRH